MPTPSPGTPPASASARWASPGTVEATARRGGSNDSTHDGLLPISVALPSPPLLEERCGPLGRGGRLHGGRVRSIHHQHIPWALRCDIAGVTDAYETALDRLEEHMAAAMVAQARARREWEDWTDG